MDNGDENRDGEISFDKAGLPLDGQQRCRIGRDRSATSIKPAPCANRDRE